MEQNEAISHDCCFERKVREAREPTTSKLDDGSYPLLPGLLTDIHLGSPGHSQSDHLNHRPPCVTPEQAEKLFLNNWLKISGSPASSVGNLEVCVVDMRNS